MMQRFRIASRIATFVLVGFLTWLGCSQALPVYLSLDGGRQIAPRLEIAQTVWDFGAVTQAATLEAGFVVKNTGGRQLLLVERSRSCDCMSAGKPEVSILPGQQATIKIVFDAHRFWGTARERYQFTTNDPRQRTLTLELLADVTAQAR